MGAIGRKVLFAIVAAWLLFVGVRAVWWATLSNEERLRERLAEMSEGFDDTRLGPALSGIAADFRGEPDGVDRQDLRRGLAALFLRAIDPKSKRFAWRVEIPEETVAVRFEGEAEKAADVTLVARFFERSGEAESLGWVLRVEGRMLDQPEDGWVFVNARAESLEGRRPRL